MSYTTFKELKSKIEALVKEAANDSNVKLKFSTKIVNFEKIVLNISACSIDLVANHRENVLKKFAETHVNSREYDRVAFAKQRLEIDQMIYSKDDFAEFFDGEALTLLEKIRDAVRCEYYDKTDFQRDHFESAYYYDIKIGETAFGFKHIA